jgi:hypothetical protein
MADRSTTDTREKYLREHRCTQETAVKCTDLVRHQATRMPFENKHRCHRQSHVSFSRQMWMKETNKGRDCSSQGTSHPLWAFQYGKQNRNTHPQMFHAGIKAWDTLIQPLLRNLLDQDSWWILGSREDEVRSLVGFLKGRTEIVRHFQTRPGQSHNHKAHLLEAVIL